MSKLKKPSRKDIKGENDVLKQMMGQMVYVMGAAVYEMNRMVEEGAKKSENTDLIKDDYKRLLEVLGIESIDPKIASEKENSEKSA